MNIQAITHAYREYGDPYSVALEAERLAYAEGNIELAQCYAFISDLLLEVERLTPND
jgi:hypothetical protein